MSEPTKTPSLLGEAFRSELEQIVEAAITKALNGNGHHEVVHLLDAKAAAKRLGVPVSWIREMARRGELPCVRLGHYLRFKFEDLDKFVIEHRK